MKCNTDGASKRNPGMSSYGYCIRDENGDLIYAKPNSIGETTNMDTEVTTARKALHFCLENGLTKVRLETDSLTLKKMLNRSWRSSW